MDALDAATLVPALLTGLLGSTHCAVMCAAPMASMTAAPRLANIPVVVEGGGAEVTHFPAHAWSQAGRVASYSVAGFVAGGFAASLGTLLAPTSVEAAGRLAAFLAQTILLATGLYLSGWTVALNWLERVAQPIWHRLQPLAGRVVPPSSPSAAFAFGALWGWIASTLRPAGIFAGQFFGDRDEWASVRPRSHHSRDQVVALLRGFEVVYLEEVEKDGDDAMGGIKHHHVFHVVGRRRASGSPT